MITVHTCRRRSWDEPPPPMDKDSPHWPGRDDRYRQLGKYVRTCRYFVFNVDKEEDRHIFFLFLCRDFGSDSVIWIFERCHKEVRSAVFCTYCLILNYIDMLLDTDHLYIKFQNMLFIKMKKNVFFSIFLQFYILINIILWNLL